MTVATTPNVTMTGIVVIGEPGMLEFTGLIVPLPIAEGEYVDRMLGAESVLEVIPLTIFRRVISKSISVTTSKLSRYSCRGVEQ
jgi:hypothetical protein